MDDLQIQIQQRTEMYAEVDMGKPILKSPMR
jgi:hypothetical protein